MDVSDIRLEKALDEYNSTVNMLEPKGTSYELVDAYVNRGCILYMMGYTTSSMEDLSAASEMIDALEESGNKVDAGTYVKAHATMGSILFEQGSEIIEEYSYAMTRLGELNPESKHFDRAGIIRMCIESAENLLDSEYAEESKEFVSKGLSILERSTDHWSENRKMELRTLMGECETSLGNHSSAVESYSEAISIGTALMDQSALSDMEELIVPIIARAHSESELDLKELYIKDMELAISLLEEMQRANRLESTDILVNLHQDLASAFISMGRMSEAEKHLMRAVSMGVNGAKDYLDSKGNNSF